MFDIEAPKPETPKNYYKPICIFCKEENPEISIYQKSYLAYIKVCCKKCNQTSDLNIIEYLNQLEKLGSGNKYFCQKKGGVHKDKAATVKLKGLFYCNECFDYLKEMFEIENFNNINDLKVECETHNKSFSYYCRDCKKNMCENCSFLEHRTFRHQVIDLKDMVKRFDMKSFKEKTEKYENFVYKNLREIKNNITQKLEQLIEQINNMYENYVEEYNNFSKLKSIFTENYLSSQEHLSYDIISNFDKFYSYKLSIPKILNGNVQYNINEKIKSNELYNIYNDIERLFNCLVEGGGLGREAKK